MKTNIKMRVTPEQSEQVQKIVFANGGEWCSGTKEVQFTDAIALYIDENKGMSIKFSNMEYFKEHEFKEVCVDLFIRTNGTCKEPKTEEDKIEKITDIELIKESQEDVEVYEGAPMYVGTDGLVEDKNAAFFIKGTAVGDPSFKVQEFPFIKKDNATNPNHYSQMKIQPNEYITANQNCFSWYTANVIKYVSRYKSKNGIEDLEKAIKYLQLEIEELKKDKQ